MITHCPIAVIGGGFAGLQVCRALRGMTATLFDPGEVTVMLPSLPDLAGGWVAERAISRPIAEMLPGNTTHIREAVTALDLDRKTLTTAAGEFSFDQLVIASGSVANLYGLEEARGRLHLLDSLASARRIRDDFAAYLRSAADPHVLVAGGGYTGLELATSLRDRVRADGRRCRITVVDPADTLLPFLPEAKREGVMRTLCKAEIAVRAGESVKSFDGARAALSGGETLAGVFLCWAAGSKFAIPEVRGKVERLKDGRLVVAPDLSLPGYPDCFAAGDAAAVGRGAPLRKAVNFAWYAGKRAGGNVRRRRLGRASRPFRPFDAGWVIPLRHTSLGQIFGNLWIGGRFGLAGHYLMCGLRNYSFANFMVFAKMAVNPRRGDI